MKTLRHFYEQAKTQYQQLRQECLSRVVRWVYSAGGPLFAFDTVDVTLAERKRGRQVPSPKKAKHKYGFDAEGRLVYEIESVDKYGFSYSYHENFKLVDGQSAYAARYYSTKGFPEMLESAEQFLFGADGKLRTRFCMMVFRGELHESQRNYLWRNDLLVRIEYPKPSDLYEEFAYDGLGNLQRHWQASSKHRTVLYQAPRKGVDLKAVQQTIREHLKAAIVQMVERAKLKQPVYCLALAYDGEGNDALPPCIGIGLEAERQRWLQEGVEKAREMVWNPAEFTHYEKAHTQLHDKTLDKACELLNEVLRAKENLAPAIKLLNTVASDLNQMDWSGRLQTTADFVVYAVDFELGNLRKNLRQSVPAGKLAKLKRAKLV